jgi:hypothetical protein
MKELSKDNKSRIVVGQLKTRKYFRAAVFDQNSITLRMLESVSVLESNFPIFFLSLLNFMFY